MSDYEPSIHDHTAGGGGCGICLPSQLIPDGTVEAAKAAIWDLPLTSIEFEWQRDMVSRAALEAAGWSK